MDDAMPRDKAELLDRIARGWDELHGALEALSEARLTAPGADGWSIKDHLAHLGAWERSAVAILEGQPRYQVLGVEAAVWQSGDTDQINAQVQARTRARPWAEVLADLRSAHAAMLAALEPRSWVELLVEYDGAPILARIAGNTYEHYAEHLAGIAALRDA